MGDGRTDGGGSDCVGVRTLDIKRLNRIRHCEDPKERDSQTDRHRPIDSQTDRDEREKIRWEKWREKRKKEIDGKRLRKTVK